MRMYSELMRTGYDLRQSGFNIGVEELRKESALMSVLKNKGLIGTLSKSGVNLNEVDAFITAEEVPVLNDKVSSKLGRDLDYDKLIKIDKIFSRFFGESPTYFDSISAKFATIIFCDKASAIAWAAIVFPVPGGP